MFNVGGGELVVIVIVALIVLGPDKLPGAARDVGRMMTELRNASKGFRDELKTAVDIASLTDELSPEEQAAEDEAYRRGALHAAQRPPAAGGVRPEPDAGDQVGNGTVGDIASAEDIQSDDGTERLTAAVDPTDTPGPLDPPAPAE